MTLNTAVRARDNFALDVWAVSQLPVIQKGAHRLWGFNDENARDGIQTTVLDVLEREDKFDPERGNLAAWFTLAMRSISQRERGKGFRRGTNGTRVFCPGEERIPAVPDLCDPESILIAVEADRTQETREAVAREKTKKRMTAADVAYIRASDKSDRELASELGFNFKSIYRLRRGETHKGTAND